MLQNLQQRFFFTVNLNLNFLPHCNLSSLLLAISILDRQTSSLPLKLFFLGGCLGFFCFNFFLFTYLFSYVFQTSDHCSALPECTSINKTNLVPSGNQKPSSFAQPQCTSPSLYKDGTFPTVRIKLVAYFYYQEFIFSIEKCLD